MEFKTTSSPEILFISTYPPRECGIATFSQDFIKALEHKFTDSFTVKICALETVEEQYAYPDQVVQTLNTTLSEDYRRVAKECNENPRIQLVVIQHEFGFFYQHENDFQNLLDALDKPVVLIFHTVLSAPDVVLKAKVQLMAAACESIVVMTNHSASLLRDEYGIPREKIEVIPHGTHLVYHYDKKVLKERYGFIGRTVLSTFGLLSEGKNIETTLNALPAIIKENPTVLFLVLGKTHPGVVKHDGERYRTFLEEKVEALGISGHVKFINRYLALYELLNYLELTDIYLFTSKDPEQAVSGTFAYAMSCACPIISTPIPHALEVLTNDTGMTFDFENSIQLADHVNTLLAGNQLDTISLKVLERIIPTTWENVVIAHSLLFGRLMDGSTSLTWSFPRVKLDHVRRLSTGFGIIQFSKLDQPDLDSGYTLDDNSRALIAMSRYYEWKHHKEDFAYCKIYLNFIQFCQQSDGRFLNYVDRNYNFTGQNEEDNLEDANGRALWALGFFIAQSKVPKEWIEKADKIMKKSLPIAHLLKSPRAIAFTIKGLYFVNTVKKSSHNTLLIKKLAHKLVHLYEAESEAGWEWFEGYLTYANSVLPEALLCAYQELGDVHYAAIAKESFDFLLAKTFKEDHIEVVSNKSWLQKGQPAQQNGEQPIDVGSTILALDRFYEIFDEPHYLEKMRTCFEWFLGNNRLHQIVYNPRTGGCYDGLEKDNINLNQGAESTVSYLMARLTVEKYVHAGW